MRETAQQLTVIDEQLHEAELIVATQQQAADAAAAQAAAAQQALDVFAPQIRAIAQSGFTGKTQSRVAAFLTSASAEELVQQMTTLDMIAAHTNTVVTEASLAQKAALDAQAAADQAAATARAGLEQLAAQKAEAEQKAAAYRADFDRLSAAEQAALATAVAGRSLGVPRDLPMPPGAAGEAIRVALAQVGDRYVSGATGPDAFDCSGLTTYAYAAAGVSLPRSSRAQSQIGTKVSRAELQPGDLVFYYTPISHVALYIGNGMIVHARTHGVPLSVTSVDQRDFRFGVRLG
ncbi:C40 family peptidase [Blastococcus brunescens]|uniref:C40 family peptidase n=1 Tax=Blastococcus brunescens TaxID=1564165 RepID=A0ABZ1AY42_9ACTN|nr:C40 family peptidase [Blastococcus sp. BMG 8361]WRL63489.1 C40 family peptidase [Blastococcus sp. BMG 8361]